MFNTCSNGTNNGCNLTDTDRATIDKTRLAANLHHASSLSDIKLISTNDTTKSQQVNISIVPILIIKLSIYSTELSVLVHQKLNMIFWTSMQVGLLSNTYNLMHKRLHTLAV